MSRFKHIRSSNIGQLVIELVAIVIPLLLLTTLLNLLPASFQQSLAGDLLLNIAAAAIIIAVFRLTLRRAEHTSLAAVGLARQQWLRQILLGFFCGGVLMSLVTLVLALTGSYHITGIQPFSIVELVFLLISLCLLALLFARNAKIGFWHYALFACLIFGFLTTTVSLLILIGGAIQEELIFRGVIFRKLEASFGSWIALGISAILFGFIHLLNPAKSLVGALAIIVTAGVLIAIVYILTRSLWWTIGIHLGWNYFEGSVFGSQISGHTLPGYFSSVLTGPAAWSGSGFGPEAGLACILIVGSVSFFLCSRAARQHLMLPRSQPHTASQDTPSERTDISVNP
ncbi:CAAX amino protease [Reticulibacter mediterranei]|uniref:CAAX amino protease n=1 Tax=Reticulibacter mediterranei TaxID=2778369 RepID=A0A8J3N4L5_9CHLR|nr:CPBP family intramembrane glutamic endopeptidase [Reticulibacter mediterranei]GHO98169.1 CAAX amino protease [Reticulibacter mediterranei]